MNTDGTNTTRTHNKQNQTTIVGSNNLTFDNAGNLTTDETGHTFTWDAWNRLIKVNGTVRYAYDALTRRVKEGSRDLYYTPSWQMVEERDGSTVVARNVWSPVYIDALVLRDRDADSNPANGLEERLYVLADANYNVTALVVATSGKVAERYVQDPYGRFDVKDGSWGTRSSSSYAWVYLHQGGRWDATSGLYSFRWRDLSPTLMRWVSVDPIGFRAGDVDLYRYEGDDPVGFTDPSGLQPPGQPNTGGIGGSGGYVPPDLRPITKLPGPPTTAPPAPPQVKRQTPQWAIGPPWTPDIGFSSIVCDGKEPGGIKVQMMPRPTDNPRNQAIYDCLIECMMKHEESHREDALRYDPNICKGIPAGRMVVVRSDLRAQTEIKAHDAELKCLRDKLQDGGVSPFCKNIIRERIPMAERERAKYLKPPGGRGASLPQKGNSHGSC